MNHEILIETEVDGAEPYAGLVAGGVKFALPGVVFGCAYGLYEALKGRDDPDA